MSNEHAANTASTAADDGLRARKRVATQMSIERAAITLAVEHGYENVTVEMICEAAMVSQRTFFNYFGSKEGVVLGAKAPIPDEEQIDTFVNSNGSNVLGDLVEMITAAMVDKAPDAELLRSRRSIIQRTPELASKEMARLGEVEEQFLRIIMDRFHAQGRDQQNTPDLEDEARMLVGLAAGVMHYAMRKWFGREFDGTPRALLHGSIDLIRRIMHDGNPTR